MWTFLIKNEAGEKNLEKSEAFRLKLKKKSSDWGNHAHERSQPKQLMFVNASTNYSVFGTVNLLSCTAGIKPFFLLFFAISVIGRNKRHDREERTQQFLSLSVTDDLKKYEKKYFSRVRCWLQEPCSFAYRICFLCNSSCSLSYRNLHIFPN